VHDEGTGAEGEIMGILGLIFFSLVFALGVKLIFGRAPAAAQPVRAHGSGVALLAIFLVGVEW
jgi:hypothetical protein